MSKVIILFMLVVCFLIMPLLISCYAEETHLPGIPYYYGSFSGYQIPFKPSKPLTEEEAKKRDAYYVAYYDDQERIVSFTKYLSGEIAFSDKYYYRYSGIIERREMTKSSGEKIIHYFNENGKLIKPE